MSQNVNCCRPLRVMMLFSQPWEIGGAKTHLETLVRQLGTVGGKVIVVGNDESIVSQLDGLPVYRINYRSSNPLVLANNYKKLRGLVKEHQIELVHAHQRTACLFAWLLKHDLNIPYTLTFHDKWRPLHRIYKFILPERGIAISQGVKDHIVRLFSLESGRVNVVENGVFVSTQTDEAQGENAFARKKRIFHASRFDEKKTHITTLLCQLMPRLYAKRPDVELVLAGDGSMREAVLAAVQEANRACGIEVVRYLGPRDDVAQLTADMDIAVGTGRFALEAMAAQKPVVAIANGNDYPGVIAPDNWRRASLTSWTRGDKNITEDNLVSDLETLLFNERLCVELGWFGQMIVRQHFSAERMVNRLCEIYDEAIHSKYAHGQEECKLCNSKDAAVEERSLG